MNRPERSKQSANEPLPILEAHELYGPIINVKARRSWFEVKPTVPVRLSLWPVGLVFALVFGVVGHQAVPFVEELDLALRSKPPMHVAPPGSPIGAIIDLPFVVGTGLAKLAVMLLATGLRLGDRYRLLPAIGFLVGCMPWAPIAGLAQLGRAARFVGHVTLVSATQLPKTKGFSNKLWALAPLVLTGLVLWLVVAALLSAFKYLSR